MPRWLTISASHTSRGRVRSLRGYERAVRTEQRALHSRDWDQPNDVESMDRRDDRNDMGKGDYWQTFRR